MKFNIMRRHSDDQRASLMEANLPMPKVIEYMRLHRNDLSELMAGDPAIQHVHVDTPTFASLETTYIDNLGIVVTYSISFWVEPSLPPNMPN